MDEDSVEDLKRRLALAEAALRKREDDFARMQRIGEVGGIDIDIANGLRSARSPEYLRLHGLPQDRRVETHADWLARVHPDDRVEAERFLFEALAGDARSYDSHYRIIRPSDGEVRWIHARADIERDVDGKAVRLVGAHSDVTEQKRSTEALRESEENYRSLFETMGQGYAELEIIRDPDGQAIDVRYVRLNPQFERLTGIPVANAVGRTVLEMIPQLDRWWIEEYDRIVRSGRPGVVENQWAGRWYEAKIYPGSGDRFTVLTEEVTVRKHAEAVLAEHREREAFLLRLSDMFRAQPDAESIGVAATRMAAEHFKADRSYICRFDQAGGHGWIGPEYKASDLPPLAGEYQFADFPGAMKRVDTEPLIVRDLFNDPSLSATDKRSIGETLGVQAMLAPVLHKGESHALWCLVIAMRLPRNWTDTELRLLAEVAERTWAAIERARGQADLKISEERLRNAVEVAQVGLWDWHIPSGAVFWSSEQFRLQGYDAQKMAPSYQAWLERLHPADRQEADAKLHEAMRTGADYQHECRMLFPDSSVHWAAMKGRFYRDDTGTPLRMIGAMIDTTQSREAAERQRIMVSELQHRTGNIMGVVQALANKTAELSQDLNDFRHRYSVRLNALSRAQRLLSTSAGTERVLLGTLMRTELSAVHGSLNQIELIGSDALQLRSSTVQILALAVHELATNAVKHGALSTPQGRLSVRWALCVRDGADWLHIDWRETGVDLSRPSPSRSVGQGRELIEQAVPYQLGGEVSFSLEADGAHCILEFPLIRPA